MLHRYSARLINLRACWKTCRTVCRIEAIGFDQVADAKLLITDKLIAATAPLSSDGAEEFETEESN